MKKIEHNFKNLKTKVLFRHRENGPHLYKLENMIRLCRLIISQGWNFHEKPLGLKWQIYNGCDNKKLLIAGLLYTIFSLVPYTFVLFIHIHKHRFILAFRCVTIAIAIVVILCQYIRCLKYFFWHWSISIVPVSPCWTHFSHLHSTIFLFSLTFTSEHNRIKIRMPDTSIRTIFNKSRRQLIHTNIEFASGIFKSYYKFISM